jgi:hypothetical protein
MVDMDSLCRVAAHMHDEHFSHIHLTNKNAYKRNEYKSQNHY